MRVRGAPEVKVFGGPCVGPVCSRCSVVSLVKLRLSKSRQYCDVLALHIPGTL